MTRKLRILTTVAVALAAVFSYADEPKGTAPSPPKEAVVPDNVLDDVLLDIYMWLMEKPFSETCQHAQTELMLAGDQNPGQRAKFVKMMLPFRESVPWESLVGQVLASSSKDWDIVIAGLPYHVHPVKYDPPTMYCDLLLNGQWVRNRPVPLAKMTPAEIWAFVSHESDAQYTKAERYSRALLILREGTRKQFAAYIKKHKLTELMPFLKADQLKKADAPFSD